jgi:hypothetical protein
MIKTSTPAPTSPLIRSLSSSRVETEAPQIKRCLESLEALGKARFFNKSLKTEGKREKEREEKGKEVRKPENKEGERRREKEEGKEKEQQNAYVLDKRPTNSPLLLTTGNLAFLLSFKTR